jgi:hypothetical protein
MSTEYDSKGILDLPDPPSETLLPGLFNESQSTNNSKKNPKIANFNFI